MEKAIDIIVSEVNVDNFSLKHYKTPGLEPFIRHLQAHKFVQLDLFLYLLFSCNFDVQLSPSFDRFVDLMYMNWDTPSEDTGL